MSSKWTWLSALTPGKLLLRFLTEMSGVIAPRLSLNSNAFRAGVSIVSQDAIVAALALFPDRRPARGLSPKIISERIDDAIRMGSYGYDSSGSFGGSS
jgi:hypothetical protein